MRSRNGGTRLCRAWLRSSRYRDLGRVAEVEGADRISLTSTFKKPPSSQLLKNVFITIGDECRPCDFQQGNDKVPGAVRLHSSFKRKVSPGDPYIITSMHVYFLRDAENKHTSEPPVDSHRDYQMVLKSAFLWERSEDISYLSCQPTEWQGDSNPYQDPSAVRAAVHGDRARTEDGNPFVWQTMRSRKLAAAVMEGAPRHDLHEVACEQRSATQGDNRVPRRKANKINIVISNDAILNS
ncbi:hypothetical protein GUITHDRAFT_142785 [Guillardia theta CCMP2712]|uniref:Uncharacterized protein n=2 Tax=Guillardia theta TaxID=55529 RepID=L1IXA0_GUITC|nr:hypothetical protein GUITHDRAFT_142785 [Guillardia theta CCMP2712]EKX40480.1 hypothetical protein GUITHDRAFT_142785 [Guillardia theta CCMP2712]|eukprot:XP_005827460.1 hypothetical protein GUITHDRAFT_142785 [Guillardia theta CCMP2712]